MKTGEERMLDAPDADVTVAEGMSPAWVLVGQSVREKKRGEQRGGRRRAR